MVVPQSRGKEGRHLKILAQVDLSKPLLRGAVVKIAGVLKWIAFKYERCPDFCYNCGVVGHSERSCKERRVLGGGNVENQYGPWMRAGNYKSSPLKKSYRPEVLSDKRYWSCRNGELIEQERGRSTLAKCLLEMLKTNVNGGDSNQELRKDRADDRIVKDTGASTYVKDSKDVPQGSQEGQLNPNERNPDLSLVHQIEEEGKDP